MHAGGVGVPRAERVAQVRAHHPTVSDYGAYVPVGGAVAKLRRWQDAGAVVDYLSSHRNPADVALDALVLRTHGFPVGRVLARLPGESYGDVAGREAPRRSHRGRLRRYWSRTDHLPADTVRRPGPDQVDHRSGVRRHRSPPRRPASPAGLAQPSCPHFSRNR